MKKIGFIIFILALGCKGRSLSPKVTRVPIDTRGLNCTFSLPEYWDEYFEDNADVPSGLELSFKLIEKSDKIFKGKAIKIDRTNYDSDGTLFTKSTFKVEIPIKGTYLGEKVIVETAGGQSENEEVGITEVSHSPVFIDNEVAILFLEKFKNTFLLLHPSVAFGLHLSHTYCWCRIHRNNIVDCEGTLPGDIHYLCLVKSLLEVIDLKNKRGNK
jgi:hypothetical protein